MKIGKKGKRLFCSCGKEYYSIKWSFKHVVINKEHNMMRIVALS